MPYEFVPLGLAGVETLLGWAKTEGLNPGLHDAEVFYNTDPQGFYGFYLNHELIAGGAIISYSGAFGFMGLFIVKPEFRGRGIGRELWFQRRDHLLSRLSPTASIGMDGVEDMQPFYHQGGFEIAFRDVRYENTGRTCYTSVEIRQAEFADFEDLLKMDRECFGFPRESFLKQWMNLPENFNFIYKSNGAIAGFAVMRKANLGFKIGPMFADSAEIAEALYTACLNAVPGEKVFLDIPVANDAAVNLVKKFNAGSVFECARMYFGNRPPIPVEKIFGITSFELG